MRQILTRRWITRRFDQPLTLFLYLYLFDIVYFTVLDFYYFERALPLGHFGINCKLKYIFTK